VQRRGPLPTFYYHEHFVEMLEFVHEHYAHTLLETHVAFIEQFQTLPTNAQCLYVRLVNRKGCVFARSRLRYPELGDLPPLLEHLQAGGWIGAPGNDHFNELLGFLTRDEIYRVLLPRFTGLGRGLKKAELVDFARSHIHPAEFVGALSADRILVQRRFDEVRYLLYLYFGRIRNSLSQFTMRDLGLVRTQKRSGTYEPRFSDRVEALEHFYFASRLDQVQRTKGPIPAMEDVAEWPSPNFPGSASLRDELAYALGRQAAKNADNKGALRFFLAGESAACSERAVRLLLAEGLRDEAREHLERCLDDPRSDEEWLAARDLYERKFGKKRTSDMTDMLRAAEVIEIDESRSGSPERAAVEYFASRGKTAFRTENLLWRTLFGLLLWEELFVEGDADTLSPFERVPASLLSGTIYDKYRDAIESKLALLRNPAAAKHQVLRISTQHYGSPNGVFRWRRTMNDAVMALLDNASGDAVATILRTMAKDYENSRYGYPDLMLVDDGAVRFVEIKAEGDQLRRNQLLRIEQLRNAGFKADVVRLQWIIDPAQTYVVIDVETTGGKGENHRVTEIGAVKIQGDQVVERFQTLLNPQRTIPPGIVRLTGITPAMVEDAPCFADIADKLECFLEDSIFVAHNVDFDYGFIAREFARIGRDFRRPRLCTCASMRRLNPGLDSYSLASLCRHFDIPLKQHHRALCDAEAAAQLLVIINEKRRARTAK
jgi:DNA polymerase-3 subunit epsilon